MSKVYFEYELPIIKCGQCGDQHSDQDSAECCCATWKCDACRKVYDNYNQASECDCAKEVD
jgi:hypothetical protein